MQRVAVSAAGPAASVLLAPLCLLLPVPRWEAAFLVLCAIAAGLQDLVPASTPNGGMTDGARLWQTRARMRSDVICPASQSPCCAGTWRRGRCRMSRGADVMQIVHNLTWDLLIAGDLPAAAVDLAASRTEWVIAHLDSDYPDVRLPLSDVQHPLAVARFRQGRARRAAIWPRATRRGPGARPGGPTGERGKTVPRRRLGHGAGHAANLTGDGGGERALTTSCGAGASCDRLSSTPMAARPGPISRECLCGTRSQSVAARGRRC
jgi:hypothetical protein